jgi:hypothetical protein
MNYQITNEFAYILGFLWGDGAFYENYFTLEILKEDLIEILPLFHNIFKEYKYSERYRKNRQPQASIRMHDKELLKWLLNFGYISHRCTSPDELLNSLNEEQQKFWYLGFLDADGCWHYNKKYSTTHLMFGSNYNQDWNFIIRLFNKFNIFYNQGQTINKKTGSKSSYIRISNKANIEKIGNYLYDGHNLGLRRKINKFNLIKTHYKDGHEDNFHNSKLNIAMVKEIKKLLNMKTNKEIAKIYDVNSKIILRIRNKATWKHVLI